MNNNKHILIMAVALFVVVGVAAWVYRDSQKNQEKINDVKDQVAGEVLPENHFDLYTIEKGDRVGAMTVTDVRYAQTSNGERIAMVIVFQGSATITGYYHYFDDTAFREYLIDEVCMDTFDPVSVAQLPQYPPSDSTGFLCFSNVPDAQEQFGPRGSSGTATVEIDEYIYSVPQVNRAKLVTVKEQGPVVEDVLEINTDEWVTYEDPKYQFRIRHPKEWVLKYTYEDAKAAYDSGEKLSIVWSGAGFYPDRVRFSNDKNEVASNKPGSKLIMEVIAGISKDDPYLSAIDLRENIQKKETYKIADHLVTKYTAIKNLQGYLEPDVTIYGEYKDIDGETKLFAVGFSGLYNDLYNEDRLLDEMVKTLEFFE